MFSSLLIGVTHGWRPSDSDKESLRRIAHISLDKGNVELLLPLQLQKKRAGVVTLGFLGGRQTDHATPYITAPLLQN